MTNDTSNFSMNLRPGDDREMELLIHCARARVESQRAERMRATGRFGPRLGPAFTLAQRNGLSPLLYSQLLQVAPG